ncbi:hypothetical protein [Nocardia fluminea]|uniref:hypothetical protein n=1 Tax=Nocardia fluminea TaxID=134984 RepID=UPI003D0AB37B
MGAGGHDVSELCFIAVGGVFDDDRFLCSSVAAGVVGEDLARFVLDPAARAVTPPQGLSACSWFSIQTSLSGIFNIRFAPAKSDLSDLAQRRMSNPSDQQITTAGQRAVLTSEIRPDGRNGSCSVRVSVPSGGSFYLGTAAPGTATGVDWDVCAKTVDTATVISARLR